MSALQLLSSYLAEVVKEILRVVEDTVTEYREEAARTRRENQSLRIQLRDLLLLEARAEWPKAGPIPGFSLEQLSLSENSTLTLPTLHSVPSSQEPVVSPELQKEEEQVSSPECLERKSVISTDIHTKQPEHVTEEPRTAAFSPASVRVKEELEERSLTDSEIEEGGDQKEVERGEEGGEDRQYNEEENEGEWRGDDGGEWKEDDGGEWRGDDGGEWRADDGGDDGADDRGEWSELEAEEPEHRLKPDPESPSVSRTDNPPSTVTQVLPRPVSTAHSAPRCPRCSETFPSPAALLQHLHQQKKTHRCDFCCKSFSQSADLRRHHRTHTGERPHRCSFCSRAFSQRGNLRRHLRIHTGERPYACPQCSRRFSDGDTLKKHLRTHGHAHNHAHNHNHALQGLYLNQI